MSGWAVFFVAGISFTVGECVGAAFVLLNQRHYGRDRAIDGQDGA